MIRTRLSSLILTLFVLLSGAGAQASSLECRSIFQSSNETAPRTYTVPGFEYPLVRLNEALGANDPVLIGFGRPNVFLVVPDRHGGSEKLAAKSLRMGPARVENTRGFVQSGILMRLRPENLRPEMVEALREAMHEKEGTRSWTCVKASCEALHQAGFTSGGRELNESFPIPLLQRLMNEGLEWRGEPVQVDLVNTTGQSLADFTAGIQSAQRRTILRHAFRKWSALERKLGLSATVLRLRRNATETFALFWRKNPSARPDANSLRQQDAPLSVDEMSAFSHWESQSSRLGTLMNLLGGEHKLVEVDLTNPSIIDRELPVTLKAYERKSPSLVTRLKKDVLFSPGVVNFLNHQIQQSRVAQPCVGPCAELPFLTPPTRDGSVERYNFVMTSDRVILTRTEVQHEWVDWILTKHVLMSNYHPDVRFAGEIWRDADGRVHLNDRSGTYAPSAESLEGAVHVFESAFPNTRFVGELP